MSGGIPLCSQELLDLGTCSCRMVALAEIKSDMMEPIGVNDREIAYGGFGVEASAIWGMSQLYMKTKCI